MIKRMGNRKNPLPPSDVLLNEANRMFRYCAETGNLIRIAHKHPRHPGLGKIGEIVGGDDGHGYRMCCLLGHKFKVHQVVWLMNTGEIPSTPIDHIDHDRRNNRFENLRLVTDFQNMQNLAACKGEWAGTKKDKKGRGWGAYIQVRFKKHYLGYFPTREEARAAYVQASRELRGEYSAV